jgi:DNA/RNA endonuclease YhcR with UshA esterase domain
MIPSSCGKGKGIWPFWERIYGEVNARDRGLELPALCSIAGGGRRWLGRWWVSWYNKPSIDQGYRDVTVHDEHPVATPLPPAAPVTGPANASGHCPNCGRFVGPYERCPYCGTEMGRRIAIRAFKYGSLVLAIVGVLVLLLVAQRSEAPVIEIGQLQGTMNWAYVGLAGVVSQQPSLDAESGTLQFWVEDGTGELLVMAYRPEAEQMVAQDKLPVMGDGITLEGTLRIKEDLTYLILNVPETVQVHPAEPVELAVASVETSGLYQKITIQGVIRDDRTPYEGLRILTVRDASGEIEVALQAGAALATQPWPTLQIGQAVRVIGAVDRYRGNPQVSVGRASDLVLLEEALAIAPECKIDQLPAMASGELAVVEGTIVQVRPFSAGVKLRLDDGSGTVTLLLWQDVYESISEREQLVTGATVRSLGEVTEYRGELEIVPDYAQDVSLVAFAPATTVAERDLGPEPATSVPDPAAAEQVTAGPATTEPTVSEPSTPEPTVGSEGTPEPEKAPSAKETAVTEPAATERQLGELSTEDVGQSVLVQGVLRSLRSFSAGVRGLLDDGTGSVTLVLWQEVFEDLPDRASLAPGVILLVEGEVSVYEGELEVIPQAAAGVTVLGQVDLGLEDRKIGEITTGDVGQVAQVAGFVIKVQFFSRGVQYVLDDGTGQLTLLLWQDVLEKVACRHDLAPGSRVRIRGEINEYEGKLEIVPGSSAEVAVLSRGERLPIEERALNTISAADEGRTFVVAGRVTRTEGDGWLRLWIEDGTGELLIFVPQRVVDSMPTGIGPGSRVRVTAEVDIYQSQLELIPLAGADIEGP